MGEINNFIIGKLKLNYFFHHYNRTCENERKIELPILFWFIDKFNGNILEVGCVSPYYRKINHPIIDLYDNYPNCIRLDTNLDNPIYVNSNCVVISTVEHLGKALDAGIGDYYDAQAGCNFVDKIYKNTKNYLITFPVGDSRVLDKHIVDNYMNNIVLMKRYETEWYKWDYNDYMDFVPCRTWGPGAEALWVFTNQEELLSGI